MKLPIYYVDAFTDTLFSGNPAAVIFSDINDSELMQNIAAENNLSETAFIQQNNGTNHIRWFSPTTEVNLCGHATLASGYVYFNFINQNEKKITFSSASGDLVVENKDTFLELDFPKDTYSEVDYINQVEDSIGVKPIKTYLGETNLFAEIENEDDVKNIKPDFDKLISGVCIVKGRPSEPDFVPRFIICSKDLINSGLQSG